MAGLVLATLILHLVLIQPNHPAAMTWQALLLFPLELPFILLLLLALPPGRGWTQAVRAVLVLFLVVVAVLKVADYALFVAFNRAFNPLVDINLIEAGVRLLAGSIGQVPTAFVVIGALAAPFLLAWALWWATGRWAAIRLPLPAGAAAGLGAVLMLGIIVAEIGTVRGFWRMPFDPPGTAFTGRVALERATAYGNLYRQLAAFREAAENDPFAGMTGLFDRLEGRDVVIVFVESYGRTSFDNPLYAPTHMATLEAGQARLAQAGLAMRSGWLTSPISGGQSWLAHGTLASGLTTGNQALYTAMLASSRKTLFDLAADEGYTTAAIMPAIVLPWPEASLLGFREVYPAAELGYRGEPFNWVTMPDQYTLSAFDRLLPPDDERRLFAQIALISSHAPWVPVPDRVDWDAVGDGTIFNEMALAGDPPSVVWRDQDRVREQYRLSVDYSLEILIDYIGRTGRRDGTVFIVLGDHPPAMFVSQIESFDVPIHIIGPSALVDPVAPWGWTEGLIPDPALPAEPMETFRNRFVGAYTSGAEAAGQP
ncbi:sulfatase [Arsenicitalea aurantiaca]|uniref:Sulfatase n=1 Tax=Arsenicitalea aurantiaca TaxID=1783274 RepID=A0A433X3J9_9HYPH|nr:sulfatase [Arsenicitalea aurantiaca]